MKLLKTISMTVLGLVLVTTAHAIDIKQEQIDQCIDGTLKYKIADKPAATKLCTCTIGVRSNMTIGQMWEIESYALSGKDPATLPYVIKLQNDLQHCTDGLELNPPKPQ